MEVEAILSEKPQSTLTEISSHTNISRTSVFRLIHSELKLKSYKIQIHQKLFEEAEDLLPLIFKTRQSLMNMKITQLK